MTPPLLAINIGSTRTGIGAFVENKLTQSAVVTNDEGDDALRQALTTVKEAVVGDDPVTLIGSVNPPAAEAVERVLTGLGLDPKRIERDVPVPIGRQLDREAIVGEDRLLNAAAAYDVLKQACIVVDAGTAITIDLVDGAGTFHGGVIAPGAGLMLASLHEHTATLPKIDADRPVEPVGHNTAEAMRAGVYHALRGMLRETVERFAEVLGSFAPVIATGGDAPWLFEDHDLIDRIVPELTLWGLFVTFRTAVETDADSND